MNFLAHLFLSEPTPDGWAGALLGDFVKGRLDTPTGAGFSPAVLHSIRLHRAVDSFTDAHALHRRSRDRFEPPLRRYAGIVVDLGYDHFLARNWHRYSPVALGEFAAEVYAGLTEVSHNLPPPARQVCERLVAQNWLVAYADTDGVGNTFARVAGRLKRQPNALADARHHFAAQYTALETDFESFFPALQQFVRERRVP